MSIRSEIRHELVTEKEEAEEKPIWKKFSKYQKKKRSLEVLMIFTR